MPTIKDMTSAELEAAIAARLTANNCRTFYEACVLARTLQSDGKLLLRRLNHRLDTDPKREAATALAERIDTCKNSMWATHRDWKLLKKREGLVATYKRGYETPESYFQLDYASEDLEGYEVVKPKVDECFEMAEEIMNDCLGWELFRLREMEGLKRELKVLMC